ncbi:uncharacterized protein LDX57_011937 [Aspergillus melleus]|uniref:uncharacterized protein n=1 Tax=Aspergillus melleus TaxID=138277 RepID=UPI001E8DF8AF|nr:uncharacterized protein LDX57_011937 [Aspergillus melleus]KAH8434297.1 hypothetical protein LDX57_011937 [Aspergillus melleus]
MSSRAMWTCDVDGCVKPAENDIYYALAKEVERDEINELIARIDTSALLSIASQLRDGVPCSLPQPPEYDETLVGGMNYHIEIEFEDGVCWMARIRRVNATSPSPELRTFIMQSEVATLKFLSKTKIPAPRVFHYDFDPGNPVGVGYI